MGIPQYTPYPKVKRTRNKDAMMNPSSLWIKLEAKLPRHVFRVGEPIDCSILLRNVSEQHLWTNCRMLFNSVHAPPPCREVWVDIQTTAGKRLAFQTKIRAGNAQTSNYRLLLPAETFTCILDLGEAFDLTMPGTYAFIVNYQDGHPEPPNPPQGAVLFRNHVRSAPIELKIAG